VIVVQNKIHGDSIVSQLADGRADFLHDEEPAVVEPAVEGFAYRQEIQEDGSPRYRITAGIPTWDGQDLETCERQLNECGVNAFGREAQHNVEVVDGGLWDQERDIDPFRVKDRWDVPQCDVLFVGVDHNTTTVGDRAGIIVAGISGYYNDHWWHGPRGYILADRSVGGGLKAEGIARQRSVPETNSYASNPVPLGSRTTIAPSPTANSPPYDGRPGVVQ
jgi:hypothetical protein